MKTRLLKSLTILQILVSCFTKIVYAQPIALWDTSVVENANCSYADFSIGNGYCSELRSQYDLQKIKVGKWVYKSIFDSLNRVSSLFYYTDQGNDSIIVNYHYNDSVIHIFILPNQEKPVSRENRELRYEYSLNGTLLNYSEFLSDSLCIRIFYQNDHVSGMQLCKGDIEFNQYQVICNYSILEEKRKKE